jgi:hypothetical protein
MKTFLFSCAVLAGIAEQNYPWCARCAKGGGDENQCMAEVRRLLRVAHGPAAEFRPCRMRRGQPFRRIETRRGLNCIQREGRGNRIDQPGRLTRKVEGSPTDSKLKWIPRFGPEAPTHSNVMNAAGGIDALQPPLFATALTKLAYSGQAFSTIHV